MIGNFSEFSVFLRFSDFVLYYKILYFWYLAISYVGTIPLNFRVLVASNSLNLRGFTRFSKLTVAEVLWFRDSVFPYFRALI